MGERVLDALPPLVRGSGGGGWRGYRGGRLQRLHQPGDGGEVQPRQRQLVHVVHVGQSPEVSCLRITIYLSSLRQKGSLIKIGMPRHRVLYFQTSTTFHG